MNDSDLEVWARRAKYFRYVRAVGGLANDGDLLEVALRCSSYDEGTRLLQPLESSPEHKKYCAVRGGLHYSFHESRFLVSLYGATPYEVTAADWEHALHLETLLEPYRDRIIDPPEDTDRCFCPKYHPRYWAAAEASEPPARAAPSAAPAPVAPVPAPSRAPSAGSGVTLEAQGRRFELKLLEAIEPNNGRMLWKVQLRLNGEDVTEKYFGKGRAMLPFELSRCQMVSPDARYLYLPQEDEPFVIDVATLESIRLPSGRSSAVTFQGALFQGHFLLAIYTDQLIATNLQSQLSRSLHFPRHAVQVDWASFEGPSKLRVTYVEPPGAQHRTRVVDLVSLSWE